MSKTTKSLLVIAMAGLLLGLVFATGLFNLKDTVWVYTILPAGAIFFGLFLISKLLEKETARYDVEQESLEASLNGVRSDESACGKASCCCSEPVHEKIAA